MQSTFVPGAVNYEGAMSRDFNAGRALSSDSLNVWHTALEPYLADAGRILDVGSGTGRFAVLMAEWFGAVVIGVEPARGMRDVAVAFEYFRQNSSELAIDAIILGFLTPEGDFSKQDRIALYPNER